MKERSLPIRLATTWTRLRGTFWFVPSLIALASVALAFLMLAVDQEVRYRDIRGSWWWIFSGGVQGARSVLGAITGSMISVTSITFSLTMVVLSLTTSQFGPRLLRHFISDLRTQLALGTFIATYLYCLVILRTIRGVEDEEFVPHVAVTVGVGLALVSISMLIIYINHVATYIQPANVITTAHSELIAAIDRLFPSRAGMSPSDVDGIKEPPKRPRDFEEKAHAVPASASGFIQAIDTDMLLRTAREHDVMISLKYRPGDYVVEGRGVADIFPSPSRRGELEQAVNAAMFLGPARTPIQDVRFGFDQIIEIAIFAMSSGVTDPHTALNCIDRLTSGMCRLADRDIPSPYRYDDGGKLRLISEPVTLSDVVHTTYGQLRQHGAARTVIIVRLLESLEIVGECVRRPEDRMPLMKEVDAMLETSRRMFEEQDLKEIEKKHRAVAAALGESVSSHPQS